MFFGKKAGEKGNGAGGALATPDSEKASTRTAPPSAAKADKSAEVSADARPKRTLELSREDFSRISDKQRNRRANAIGKIVSLLARAPGYQDMRLKDLEWFLMPAIAAGQYMIGETKPSAERRGGVAAMLLWARVSPEVDKRLSESTDKPPRLKPEEWTSGDIVRVIEVVGRKDAIKPLLAEFKRTASNASGPRIQE